jgi:hypothetical protein
MTYLINYLILSEILMLIFLLINKSEVKKSYLSFEGRRGDEPTSLWYTIYLLSYVLKAPFYCPYISLLILLNGGVLITDDK